MNTDPELFRDRAKAAERADFVKWIESGMEPRKSALSRRCGYWCLQHFVVESLGLIPGPGVQMNRPEEGSYSYWPQEEGPHTFTLFDQELNVVAVGYVRDDGYIWGHAITPGGQCGNHDAYATELEHWIDKERLRRRKEALS